jgi:hypothetical protein
LENEQKNPYEEFEVDAGKVVDEVKKLIAQGNVRRLILRKENDEVLMEIPLTAGVAAGSILTIFAPVLAALGAMAALLARVKIQVVRVEDDPAAEDKQD